MSINIRPAIAADYEQLTALLQSEDLPVEDIDPALQGFLVAESETGISATIGLEEYGTYGLLRSMITAGDYRDQGLGSKLVKLLLEQAGNKGMRSIYLVTNTAERFFERIGFVSIARTEVPAAVLASGEFNGLCPDSATVMQRAL